MLIAELRYITDGSLFPPSFSGPNQSERRYAFYLPGIHVIVPDHQDLNILIKRSYSRPGPSLCMETKLDQASPTLLLLLLLLLLLRVLPKPAKLPKRTHPSSEALTRRILTSDAERAASAHVSRRCRI